jgi:hypothetical protein
VIDAIQHVRDTPPQFRSLRSADEVSDGSVRQDSLERKSELVRCNGIARGHSMLIVLI